MVSLPDNKLEISGGKRQETSATNMDLLRRFYETIVEKYSVNAARESGPDVGVYRRPGIRAILMNLYREKIQLALSISVTVSAGNAKCYVTLGNNCGCYTT